MIKVDKIKNCPIEKVEKDLSKIVWFKSNHWERDLALKSKWFYSKLFLIELYGIDWFT